MKSAKYLLASLFIFIAQWSYSQTKTVSGFVYDDEALPIAGAAVYVSGTRTGTVTDADGRFVLKVDADAATLTVSFMGYVDKEVEISSSTILVYLVADTTILEETVVIGYGRQKKTDLTGSVSSVSQKDFNQGMLSSPEQMINGKIAGVQITDGGGSPTAGSTIRIRGGASLNASNDPLIVLDGVPMEVGGSVSGAGNFLSLINPNDIESFTVLKDASSTAIYGSRASNGVIIITTKKGSANGKLHINFTSTNSLNTPCRYADSMSAQEFKDVIMQEGSEAQQALLGTSFTDWNKEVYQLALGTDNNLGISGSIGKNLPYRVSLGYHNQDGIVKKDNATRYTGSLTLSPSFFDNHLKINAGLKGTYSHNTFANTNAIWGAATHNPTAPVYSGNDAFLGYYEAVNSEGGVITGATANPAGLIANYDSQSDVYRLIANADADYSLHFLPELHLHATLGYDYSNGRGTVWVPKEAYQYYASGGRNYSYGPQENHNALLTLYANYANDFGLHHLDATLGYDFQSWIYTNAAYVEYNDEDPAVVQSSSSASDERHTLLSTYGRLNYSYDSRYLITATLRLDGSSRFSPQNRWGIFPSVAAAWNIAQEAFFEPAKSLVNDLKLRLSYGVTGQQDGIANYSYLPVYTVSQPGAHYMFGGEVVPTYRPSAYNEDLKWETTAAWNAGLDFAFLENRVNGSIDFYTRKTRDLLATVPAAAGTNFDKVLLTNVGNISSRGVEFTLNATLISTKDFSWSVSGNATWQQSRITNLRLNEEAESPNTLTGAIESHYVQVLSEGYAPYSYYVYKQVYDQESGRPIEGLYADLDGDGNADRYHFHSPAPDWILGFSTSFQYRNWTLSTSLRANLGGYLYNGMAMNTGAWETVSYNQFQLNKLNRSYFRTGFQTRQHESDLYVENASFLKMDNIQLSYNFGRIKDLFGLTISAMCQNVFTLTGYTGLDPECNGGIDMAVYPRPRIFTLSVGLDF
ncbi:MAG: SusC/RagA family TonB-linked outer membrane protein [Candidatus Cryptobacteroides sp.]